MTHRPNAITRTREFRECCPGGTIYTFIIFGLFTTPKLWPPWHKILASGDATEENAHNLHNHHNRCSLDVKGCYQTFDNKTEYKTAVFVRSICPHCCATSACLFASISFYTGKIVEKCVKTWGQHAWARLWDFLTTLGISALKFKVALLFEVVMLICHCYWVSRDETVCT